WKSAIPTITGPSEESPARGSVFKRLWYSANRRTRARRDIVLRHLAVIAQIGWEQGRVADALTALERFRQEFSWREGASLWLRQLRDVAVVSLIISLGCFAAFLWFRHIGDN